MLWVRWGCCQTEIVLRLLPPVEPLLSVFAKCLIGKFFQSLNRSLANTLIGISKSNDQCIDSQGSCLLATFLMANRRSLGRRLFRPTINGINRALGNRFSSLPLSVCFGNPSSKMESSSSDSGICNLGRFSPSGIRFSSVLADCSSLAEGHSSSKAGAVVRRSPRDITI